MAKKAISPDEIFNQSPMKDQIIGYFIDRLMKGQRTFNRGDALPKNFIFIEDESVDNIINMTKSKKLSDVLPVDFQKRLIAEFKKAGWSIKTSNEAITFSEAALSVDSEKQLLKNTQIVTNLINLINAKLQTGVRKINKEVIESNLTNLSVDLDVPLKTAEELTQYLGDIEGFGDILRSLGWVLERDNENECVTISYVQK